MSKTVIAPSKRIEKNCQSKSEFLAEVETNDMLDELTRRGFKITCDVSTEDLIEALAERRETDITVVDEYDVVSLRVSGPAVIATVIL